MTSPADPKYLSRRQLEELIDRLGNELQGSLLLFKAVVSKVGPVDLTVDEVTAAAGIEVQSTPIEGGFQVAVAETVKEPN